MPDVKISALPSATAVGTADIFVLNQGGVTKTAAKSLITAGLATTDQIGGLNSAQVQSLTSAQIAAITPATIGAVATSDIIGISKGGTGATDAVSALSALGGITSAAISGFASTSQLSGFATTTQIVGIAFTSQLSAFTNTAQVSAIASAQIASITPASIGAVSTSAVIAISKGGTGATDAPSALSNLGGITSAALTGYATTAQVGGLSSAQVNTLAADQILALGLGQDWKTTTEYKGGDVVSVSSQVYVAKPVAGNINQNPMFSPSYWFLADTNAATIVGQPVDWTAPSIGNILVYNGSVWISSEQASGLSSSQVEAITSSQISAITPASIGALSTDAASGFATTTQIAGIAFTSQLSAFQNSAQVQSLASAQIAAITPASIGAVSTGLTISTENGLTGGGALTTDRILSLTTTGVSALSYGSSTQIAALTVDAYGRLTAASNQAITPAGIGAQIALTSAAPLAIDKGGTGAISAQAAISNLGIGMRMVEAQTTANIVGTMATGPEPDTFTVTATGVFATDGYTPVLGDIIAFALQTTTTQNGFWEVTTVGAVGVSAVFTRPSWYTGTVRNMMYMTRFGSAQNGFIQTFVGPTGSGNTEITVGTTNITMYRVNLRASPASLSTNLFTGYQTFRANAATTNTAPFYFQAGAALMTTPQGHAVEWFGDQLYLTTAAGVRTTNTTHVAIPAISTSAGLVGQVAVDNTNNWLYVCTATNVWKRAALTTF